MTIESSSSLCALKSRGVPSGSARSTSLHQGGEFPAAYQPDLAVPDTVNLFGQFRVSRDNPVHVAAHLPAGIGRGLCIRWRRCHLSPPSGGSGASLPAPLTDVLHDAPELLPGPFERALGLVPGPALCQVADQFRQALLLVADVQAVDRLGEAEVSVDARDHDARVDGDQLDADQRQPHVGIDDQALVQDRVDNVGQPRGLRPGRAAAARLYRRGHVLPPRRAPRAPLSVACASGRFHRGPPAGRRPRRGASAPVRADAARARPLLDSSPGPSSSSRSSWPADLVRLPRRARRVPGARRAPRQAPRVPRPRRPLPRCFPRAAASQAVSSALSAVSSAWPSPDCPCTGLL